MRITPFRKTIQESLNAITLLYRILGGITSRKFHLAKKDYIHSGKATKNIPILFEITPK
jgi:hypothetical protein